MDKWNNWISWNGMKCGSRISCLSFFSRAHTKTTQTKVCMHSITSNQNKYDRHLTNQIEFGRFFLSQNKYILVAWRPNKIYNEDGVQLPTQKIIYSMDKFRSTKLCTTNVANHMRVTSFAISSFLVDKFAKPWADGVPELYVRVIIY